MQNQDNHTDQLDTHISILEGSPDFDSKDGEVLWPTEMAMGVTMEIKGDDQGNLDAAIYHDFVIEGEGENGGEKVLLARWTMRSIGQHFAIQHDANKHFPKRHGSTQRILCGCCNSADSMTEEDLRTTTRFTRRTHHISWAPGPQCPYILPYPFPAHLDTESTYVRQRRSEKQILKETLPLVTQDSVVNYVKSQQRGTGYTTDRMTWLQLQKLVRFTLIFLGLSSFGLLNPSDMSRLYKDHHNRCPRCTPFPPPPRTLLSWHIDSRETPRECFCSRASNISQIQKYQAEFRDRVAKPNGDGDDEPRLCEECRKIPFKSFFEPGDKPKSWILKPAPSIWRRYYTCRFCRFLCDAALRHHKTLDGAYKTVNLVPDSLIKGHNVENPFNTSITIVANGSEDIPRFRALLVAERYNDTYPLKARISSPHVIDTSLAKYWLRFCEDHHKECGPPPWIANTKPWPIKVIDVRSYTLVEATTNHKYCALSYVWGKSVVFKTFEADVYELCQPGGLRKVLAKLPKTILDAIRFVEAIGEKYLWVDSICIVQDDKKHMARQISNMTTIYSRATLTIIAAGGCHADFGLPGIWPHLRLLLQVTEKVDDGIRLALPLQPSRKLNGSTWNTRAWTFQEDRLSTRTIVFIDDQVFWKYRTSTWFEDIISEVEETPRGMSLTSIGEIDKGEAIIHMVDGGDSGKGKRKADQPTELQDNQSRVPPISNAKADETVTVYPTDGPLGSSQAKRAEDQRMKTQNTPQNTTIMDDLKPHTPKSGYNEPFSPNPKIRDVLYRNIDREPSLLSWNYREYVVAVAEYTKRSMTKDTDADNAFMGLQGALEFSLQAKFLYGIPTSHFDAGLLWMPEANLERRCWCWDKKTTPPSWSWLGWRGPVRYATPADMGPAPRHQSWEVQVHPVVRWDVSTIDGVYQHLNGHGVGMMTVCEPDGQPPEEWLDNRWAEDCLYASPIPTRAEPSPGDELHKFGKRLRFHTYSAEFMLLPLQHDATASISADNNPETDDNYEFFSSCLRPSVPCHKILGSDSNIVGYIAPNASESIGNKQAEDEAVKVELVVIAITGGRHRAAKKYDGYAVMAIERNSDTVERLGIGQIDQDAWWKAETDWKEIVLE